MATLVSICLPNLNMLRFLRERLDSICAQTYPHWELFVYDSRSDDGSWEYLNQRASKDPRVRLVQGPREGPYPAWNECVRQTKGEFVYIATSDDTMAPNFLEEMVHAMDRHPECGLAHSPLLIIGEDGIPLKGRQWPAATVFTVGSEDMAYEGHVRRAPFDGLLHLTGRHAYLSITQLLIRRTLFAKIGEFSNRWGPVSDFNWEMKAGLVTDTVHVPTTWATWRIHPAQLTAPRTRSLGDREKTNELMIDDALQTAEALLPARELNLESVAAMRRFRKYRGTLVAKDSWTDRRIYQAKQFVVGPWAIRKAVLSRFVSHGDWYVPHVQAIRKELERKRGKPVIEPDDASEEPALACSDSPPCAATHSNVAA